MVVVVDFVPVVVVHYTGMIVHDLMDCAQAFDLVGFAQACDLVGFEQADSVQRMVGLVVQNAEKLAHSYSVLSEEIG